MAAWTEAAARFETALAQWEAKTVMKPVIWIESNLFDALSALASDKYAEADKALDNLARHPTAREVAHINSGRERLTPADMRERFEMLKQRLR
jgi:hypothetical protein